MLWQLPSIPPIAGRVRMLFWLLHKRPYRVIAHKQNPLTMLYFTSCSSLDEVKAMYKTLAKKFHPDCGGDTETMQAINVEYAHACAKAIRGENLTDTETDEQVRMSEEYRAVIEKLCSLVGIVIEVVGNWIWGNRCNLSRP